MPELEIKKLKDKLKKEKDKLRKLQKSKYLSLGFYRNRFN